MIKATNLEDNGSHNEHIDPVFVGRDAELRFLEDHYQRRGGAIVITGPRGSGKTALLNKHLSTDKKSRNALLISSGFGPEVSPSAFQQRMVNLLQANEVPEIVALDNMPAIGSGEQIEEISRIVLNYKRVRSLVFVTRQVSDQLKLRGPVISLPPLNQASAVKMAKKLIGDHVVDAEITKLVGLAQGSPLSISLLAQKLLSSGENAFKRLLKGDLYNMNTDLIVPQRKLYAFAKPKLIMAGETLAERLKANPQSVYDLSPREYEVLLAELLDGMGYEVELTPETRDGGRDIMAYMNTPHGRLLCLVEAKKYRADRTVGVGLVRELYGTFVDSNATNAMLVTTSRFSRDAQAFQSRHQYQLTLRDYQNVFHWIENHKV